MAKKFPHPQACLRGHMRIFCGERGVYSTGVLGTSACMCVNSIGVFDIAVHICDTITEGCAHALVCALFVHVVGGRGWVGSTSHESMQGNLDRRRDGSVVLCLLFFNAGGSEYGCICVYTNTHTHTAHGVLEVSPGVGTRHVEGSKNPDGLNLGIDVLVYVYKVHMYIYMLGGGMRSKLITVFL